MPDVISTAPADVRLWVALDVHKFSIVAAVLPPAGGRPEVSRIETTEKAIRRFIKTLGGPEGLAAGRIGAALALAPATLSFHLRQLSHAGLIHARQQSRFIYYSADVGTE